MSSVAPHPASSRLSASTIARYAAGSLGTGGFATLPGLVLVYYMTDNLGIAAGLAGVIIALSKFWDVLIDPFIGALTDRQRARTGSRRGYMLVGACALPVLFALTFAVPPSLGPLVGAIWVMITFTATATAFSLFQVPYIALPAELTSGYDERTRLLTWRVVVLTLAILLFGGGAPALREVTGEPVTGYLVMGIVAGAVIGVGMLIATTVNQRTQKPTETMQPLSVRAQYAAGLTALRRSEAFRSLWLTYVLQALATGLMLAGAQYIATWVMASEAAVTFLFVALIAPALLAAPGWGALAKRLGKARSFRLATALFAIAALSITVAVWSPGSWMYISVAVAGVAYAGMQSLPMAMLPDVVSHDKAHGGTGDAGAFSGVWTAGETVGFALSGSAIAAVLALTGYRSTVAGVVVEQPDSAIFGIVLAFSVIPALLAAASLIPLSRYRLSRTDIDVSGTAP